MDFLYLKIIIPLLNLWKVDSIIPNYRLSANTNLAIGNAITIWLLLFAV